jgi:hypothetical protein
MFVAACGGSPAVQEPSPTSGSGSAVATAPAGSGIELGEMTIFDGEHAVVKIHANGQTEIAGGSDALSPGPTLDADGTVEAGGKPRVRIVGDKLVDVSSGQTVPVTVGADSLTVTGGATPITMSIGADGTFVFTGADVPPGKAPRVQGADTPGKKRAALLLLMLLLGADAAAESGSAPAATPATPAPPTK